MYSLKDKVKTFVFETYEDFIAEQKIATTIFNGVSSAFAAENPDYEKDNETNVKCWNCINCKECIECVECKDSKQLSNCIRCHKCDNLSQCDNCIDCHDSTNLTRCKRCQFCNNLKGYSDTIDHKTKKLIA